VVNQAIREAGASQSLEDPRASLGAGAADVSVGIPNLTHSELAADPGHGVLDVRQEIHDRVCLALQTLVLEGRPILRVPRAQPSVNLPRRSVRFAAKPRAPNPIL
jgi:hypothetical protein